MNIKNITADSFEQDVLQDRGTVLVDFFAEWCGPCKALAPVLEELAEEGSIQIGKVNVDESPELAQRYSVMSVPTMILFREGQPDKRLTGYMEKDEIKAAIG